LHRNILVASAVLLLLAVLVYALRAQILTGIADLLVVNDPLQPADIIFVLNGDYNTRPFRASELYEKGLAPVIIITKAESLPAEKLSLAPNDTDVSIGVMKALGVPPEKIVVLPVEGGTTSTFDEAIALRQYIESHNVHSLILLTSAFHTRRAKWIFDRELSGLPVRLEVAAVPHYGFDESDWWQSEDGLITLNNEYIKLVYYFVKYR
jgi:uncharacterized SAM-binding protein YcdF (DUF218 family)